MIRADHATTKEAMARAMCAAAGNDPNAKVFPVDYVCERIQGRADYQKLPTDYVVVPAWELWVGDAEAALAYMSEASKVPAPAAEVPLRDWLGLPIKWSDMGPKS